MNSAAPLPGLKTVMGFTGKPELAGNEQIIEIMEEFYPDVVGYSVMTGEHYDLLELNRRLKKEYDFYAIMGGPHPTFNMQIIQEESLDAICVGEGDATFPDFIRRLEDNDEYWLTQTFNVKYEGKIYRNPLRDLVPDLDDLPFPDRRILYDADPNMATVGAKSFITARGCPYRCSYCFNKQFNDMYKDLGKTVRVRTPELVIREIEWVKARYPLDMVAFIDDIFFLKPSGWIEEFAKLYKKRIGLPCNGNVRANIVKDRDIALLRDAGLSHVWMGVECGDEKAANEVFLRDMGNDVIIEAASVFRKHGVKVIALNIMGLPVDDPFRVDMATVDLNLKLKPALASCGLLYPYPGTVVERFAKAFGHFTDDQPYYLESNKRSSMMKFKSVKEKRMVENLQKLAGIIVEFPFLRPFARFLCTLPFGSFYHLLFYIHLGYCHKIRLSPFKSLRKELPIFTGVFFKLLAKT